MPQARPSLFLSHADEDDPVVRPLPQALAELEQPVWIDSRQRQSGELCTAPRGPAPVRRGNSLLLR